MKVTEQIKGYLERVEDINYLENILGTVPLPDLQKSLLALLNSSNHEDVARADWFLNDVIYRTKGSNEAFMSDLMASGLPVCYEQNVFRTNFWIRRYAIGTLNTFYGWWSSDGLNKALAFLETHDPISLPLPTRLLMWRLKWEDWSLPKRLIYHSDFLVRWSVLGLLSRSCIHFPLPNSQIVSESKTCLYKLQLDENVAVRNEADFLAATLSFYEIMPDMEKPQKRKRSKELNAVAPKLRFADLWMQVSNQLSKEQKVDFSPVELHEYIQSLICS